MDTCLTKTNRLAYSVAFRAGAIPLARGIRITSRRGGLGILSVPWPVAHNSAGPELPKLTWCFAPARLLKVGDESLSRVIHGGEAFVDCIPIRPAVAEQNVRTRAITSSFTQLCVQRTIRIVHAGQVRTAEPPSYEPESREFESLRAHHFLSKTGPDS